MSRIVALFLTAAALTGLGVGVTTAVSPDHFTRPATVADGYGAEP
ncbi:hypothetical protein Lfu02_61130 [Longispora fulva]|uniref:Uncharacterized protein n=1 Tax=Longispora fulva TaxID=619741 RepID=A0A8J7GMT3_9ACTN|nr:hypothetical protein [Longispora fulva]MBG6134533.1 hypothetical protein [Longispora fulva]GIG61741.1 hypothetical protein Lfu02_61130 [Longispora fulva]